MSDTDYPTPMMGAACMVSTEATFVEDDDSEHDEHILGMKMMGLIYLGDNAVGAQTSALLPKEFARNLRDALTEWLNDGGHFHVGEDEWERLPEHGHGVAEEETEEADGEGEEA